MLENARLNSSIDQIELGFMEREATPEFLMKLSIQLYLSSLSLSNIVRFLDTVGAHHPQSTVRNLTHKADLQPEFEKNPDHIVVDETVTQLNDVQYWLYAAVDPETNELLQTTLETTRNTIIAQKFLAEIRKKHDVSAAVFLVDGSPSLQAACR